MTDFRPTVVLLGIDRLLGLQLARILWQRGSPVVGVAVEPTSHYARTRAAVEILPAQDFEADPAAALMRIRRAGGTVANDKPILIPCTDEYIWWLDRLRSDLAPHADFLLAAHDCLERLADKARFCRELEVEGTPLPLTRIAVDGESLRQATGELAFPIVVKPSRRSPAWMHATGGAKVLRVDDPDSLQKRCEPLLAATSALVLQQWIPGGDDCMYSVFVCLDGSGEPAMQSLVVRKLRQWPPEIGVGSLAEQVSEPELAAQALEILKARGFVGTGSLQFKRDADTGRFVVIEMNTRFALGFPICETSGIEATWIHCLLAAGRTVPASVSSEIVTPGRKWICWKRDLASALTYWRRGELSIPDWLRSLRGRKRSADIMFRDPLPTLCDAWGKVSRFLS